MSTISLPHQWSPRHYQRDYLNHMFSGGEFPYKKRAQLVWHRRAGKDSTSINTLAVSSQMRVGTYWHMLPTLNQARKVVWNGVDGDGRRIIYQAFPRELIESVNENEMLIRLRNGSFYQVVGSDNYDSLVGTNPLGVVFSEWSIADPRSWDFVRPILNENDGFATFIYTPRGRNHAYDMWRNAQGSDRWFTSHQTVETTFRDSGLPVISLEDIEQERRDGVMEEVIQQEYYCSFEGINVGSIYGKHLQKYAPTNQIVFPQPYQPNYLVYTAWDIGRRDATAVWFYQIIGDEIHIIDYTEGTGLDASEWLEKLRTEFPYQLATPALPHDARAKTFSSKYTTEEVFIKNKIRPYIVKMVPREQGINAVREILPKVFFNIGNPRVKQGLERLEGYQYTYDEKLKVFSKEPLHDHNSHGADAFRMLALSQNVMEVAYKNKNMIRTEKPSIMTGIGRALNLRTLFEEREQARRNQSNRV